MDELTLVCHDILSRCFIITASLLVNGGSRIMRREEAEAEGLATCFCSPLSLLYTCLEVVGKTCGSLL